MVPGARRLGHGGIGNAVARQQLAEMLAAVGMDGQRFGDDPIEVDLVTVGSVGERGAEGSPETTGASARVVA